MSEKELMQPKGSWTLSLRLAAHIDNLRMVRWAIAELKAILSLDDTLAYSLEICAVEAATNIVRHGYDHDPSKDFLFAMGVEEHSIQLIFEDRGARIPEEKWAAASQLEDTSDPARVHEGGRGLFLMRELMDEIEYLEGDPNRLLLRKSR